MKKTAFALLTLATLAGCSDKISKTYKSNDGKTLEVSLITDKDRRFGKNEEGYPAIFIYTDSTIRMYDPKSNKAIYCSKIAHESDSSNVVNEVSVVDYKGIVNHAKTFHLGDVGTEKGFAKADSAFRKGVDFLGKANAGSLESEMKQFGDFDYK